MHQRSLAWRLTSRRRCCTNPTLQEPERRISWLMETSWTLFWNSPTLEALYQVKDALTMKYRGGWPRLVHLSANYARNSGTTTMCPCGLKARYTVQSCCPPSYMEPRPGQCTDDRWKSCMPSWCDHEDNLDGQNDKQGNTRTDRAAIYGRSSDQKESPVDWTPHVDVTRQATEAGSLLPTVFWSEKERAPSSPVQRYHQEKHEAESHKDRLMDVTLTADR